MITAEQVGKLLSEHAQLVSSRSIWVDRWEDIVEYVAPHYGSFSDIQQDLSTIGEDIYDSTAVNSSQRFAFGVQGNLVGKSLVWFKMQPDAPALRGVKEIRDWMQKGETQLYSALDQSNFYESLSEFLLSGARFGTSVMYVDENVEEGTIDFQNIHLREVTIKEDSRGKVVQLDREFYLTATQAIDKFGAENLPSSIVAAADDRAQTLYKFIHIVSKRGQRDRSRADSKNMPWSSLYLCTVNEDDGSQVVREGGYRTFPYIVWRMSKPSRDPWGVSPAMDHIKTIVMLNVMMKAELQGIQLAVQPPWLVSDTLIGLAERTPNAIIPTRRDAGETITPIGSGNAIPLIDGMRNWIDQTLDRAYFLDVLAALSMKTQQMTAAEVMQRAAEKATMLSPIVGRLESEVLDPVLERVYDIESNAGRMPPMSRDLAQYGGANIRIDYIGPLAEAQRRYHATEGNMQALQMAMPFIELAQSTGKQNPADYIDTDQGLVNAMDAGGADSNIVLDKADVEKIRQQKAQAAAQQQQLAAAATAADQYKNLTKAPENGSPAQQLTQQPGAA